MSTMRERIDAIFDKQWSGEVGAVTGGSAGITEALSGTKPRKAPQPSARDIQRMVEQGMTGSSTQKDSSTRSPTRKDSPMNIRDYDPYYTGKSVTPERDRVELEGSSSKPDYQFLDTYGSHAPLMEKIGQVEDTMSRINKMLSSSVKSEADKLSTGFNYLTRPLREEADKPSAGFNPFHSEVEKLSTDLEAKWLASNLPTDKLNDTLIASGGMFAPKGNFVASAMEQEGSVRDHVYAPPLDTLVASTLDTMKSESPRSHVYSSPEEYYSDVQFAVSQEQDAPFGYGYELDIYPQKGSEDYYSPAQRQDIPIVSPFGGEVVKVIDDPSDTRYERYGHKVMVKISDDTYAVFAHNSSNSVKEGDIINPGQIVGYFGETGSERVSGVHVHLELVKDGQLDSDGRLKDGRSLTADELNRYGDVIRQWYNF